MHVHTKHNERLQDRFAKDDITAIYRASFFITLTPLKFGSFRPGENNGRPQQQVWSGG